MNSFQGDLASGATKAMMAKLVRVLLPAILGAIGGTVATILPAYFNAFCGL